MAVEDINEVIGHDSYMDKQCRVWASISFAVLLLGVGLPLWWETTAVQRAKVPYSEISALDEHKFRINLKLLVGCDDLNRSELLGLAFMSRVSRDSEIFRVTVSHFAIGNSSIARAKTIDDLEKAAGRFDLKPGDLLLLEAPAEVNFGDQHVYVSNKRAIFFSLSADLEKVVQVLRNWIYREDALTQTRNALADPTEFSMDVDNRRRFPASSSYDVLLTIVNPDPEQLKLDRSLTNIAQEYIAPFLDEISVIANFSIKSQWLYLLPLGVKPKQVSDTSKSGRHFALAEDMLPQIITPLEKKLASQVSLHPTINLVMYMVPCNEAPLYIYARNGRRLNKDADFEAFHSPRWGGVTLVNPPAEFCEQQNTENEIFKPSQNSTIGVFLSQLRLLLGIIDKDEIDGVHLAPLSSVQPRGWEVDDLLRIRSVEQLTSAKLTLQSLARLLREISNIVITDTVGRRINAALKLVQYASKQLEAGELLVGFIASREAFVEAEAAFTDPSLLALLYFPDDQKYAVYIPLFLPVMIPVLFSLKNIKNYLFCS